jgi:hypothetical protein
MKQKIFVSIAALSTLIMVLSFQLSGRMLPKSHLKPKREAALSVEKNIISETKLAGLSHHFGQGMKGHPDYTSAQIPAVIQMAKDMGLNSFRGDFNTDNNGNPSDNGDQFLKATKAEGMNNYVILYIKGRGRPPLNGTNYTAGELQAAEQANYTAAKGFASRYPEVKYYQLDNELDVKAVGDTHKSLVNYWENHYGLSKEDNGYNLLTYPLLIVQLKAMIRGIKEAVPQAKCGMNYAWRHAGILQRINKDVPLDFVGIDAYNSEEYAKDEHGRPTYGRFVDLLKGDFPTVPQHFVAEMGFKPGKSKNLTAAEHLPTLFRKYLTESDGVFLYEAINEPKARANSNDRDEAVLGMNPETVQRFHALLQNK